MKKQKLLVANRAEIACRVMQACREMGISTVAIVAPGDEQGRHVTVADEVLEIGSYLDGPAIVEAAIQAGVTLIHPGYGFLSERPSFARAVEKAGMVFVGPRAETMEAMGEKIASKELAEKIGVPTLPWTKVETGGDLAKSAAKIGYPLLLKASAGGGGKGMRRVERLDQLEEAAEGARAEAKGAFGDDAVFLEKLVLQPRHIEVQVFGDGRGEGVHLFARECSLQRRHQKVWEEAPAPHLPQSTLDGLYEAALKLVRATKYRSAGTVEFLVDGTQFYFLEMNTRLQVEHPVTEEVTGVDLVHAQISLALDPKKFALEQPARTRGHAIEVRLYAEDPSQGFMPAPGRVEKINWGLGAGIRIDSGIEEGQEISSNFDPMLAKIVVHAPTRELAIARIRFALDETVVLGVGTNQRYLREMADLPEVIAGKVSTKFLEEKFPFAAPDLGGDDGILEALEAYRAQGGGRSAGTAGNSGRGSALPSPWESLKSFEVTR